MQGPLLLLLALGLFAALDANSKLLAGAYPVAQVVLIRHLVLLALLFGARALRPGLGGPLGTAHPRLHLLRALAMLGSAVGFFQALREIPLAEGYLVYFTAPLHDAGARRAGAGRDPAAPRLVVERRRLPRHHRRHGAGAVGGRQPAGLSLCAVRHRQLRHRADH
ncbi:hypothetical protein ACFFMP_11360 [Pseudoroseomonas cervicalis]|uniref:hypothetical protein n=1 Tax=Teichococcus cervicalis TaxID=204525 RepID=UPI0035E8D3C8